MGRATVWAILLCTVLLTDGIVIADTSPHSTLAADPGLQDALERISPNRMMADLARLSSAEFRGRQAGTEDDHRTAAWVGDQFKSSGLSLAAMTDIDSSGSPAGLMTSIVSVTTIDAHPVLGIGPVNGVQTRQLERDFMPVLDSPPADIRAPIVFVGYGTLADYATVDVHDCIVFFLRGKPDHYAKPMSHAEKVQLARANGAVGYLTAVGPVLNSYEARKGVTGSPTAFYGQLPAAEAIPGAWISTHLAEDILAPSGAGRTGPLREIQVQLNRSAAPQSLRTHRYGLLHWETSVRDGRLANVLARLPGTGPETVVIGAHRDHFGKTAGLVFPGADDNASGTAVILEVGRVLAEIGWRPTRSILFISFSGEEKDLLGSRLYVARPAVPLMTTTAMINVDHAGVGNGRLTVGVTGSEKTLALEAGQSAGLGDKLDLFGFFPGGDHVPFKEAGIPTVTVVSGGVHPHFHLPTDTVETINPEILGSIARYVLALAWRVAGQP